MIYSINLSYKINRVNTVHVAGILAVQIASYLVLRSAGKSGAQDRNPDEV